ncbi:MAG: hypothetical protein JNK89_00055, partial [Saprospiraceae bacterium]|nr:hypothetical protein [Saprospiraceae bacterium]
MKRFLLLLSIILLPTLAPAQCYTILRDDGIAKLNAQRYDEAIALFQGAKKCDDKPIDGDARLDAMIAAARREALS